MFLRIRKKLLKNFSLATSLVFLTFGTLYLLRRIWILGGFEFSLGVLQLLNIGFLRWFKREIVSFRILVGSVYLMSFVIFLTGGFGNTGFLWIEFIPLFTMLMLDRRESLVWSGTFSTALILIIFFHFRGEPLLSYTDIQIVQSVVVYLLFMYLTVSNERLKEMAREKLEDQNRELERLNRTDGLTGLHNRTWFNRQLNSEFLRFERYHTPFSLIMLDIDKFKTINDRYGHQKGDEVLLHISEVLRCETRNTDDVARWGGEEFLILCPETNQEDAGMLAEKLRESIESLSFEEGFEVTASFGVAQIEQDDTVNTLLSETDRQLYIAKENGRNRVFLTDRLVKN